MHNNYFLLRNLVPIIESRLKGSVVSECFSQNKNELVIRFESTEDSTIIRGSFSPSFACLSFPTDFHRARKNSIDLFPDLIGLKVVGARQYKNERSFAINLSDNWALLFKMHGNRSNCLLIENNIVTGLFNQSIESDLELDLSRLDRDIDWSFDAFVKNHGRLETHFFTFGKQVWRYLADKGFNNLPIDQQWISIQEVLGLLGSPTYYVGETDKKITLSLLPSREASKDFSNPVDALNFFYTTSVQEEALESELNMVAGQLKSSLRSRENFYQKSLQRLQTLQQSNNYKIWADLIMANLHVIEDNIEKTTVRNFYDENRAIEIPLNQQLSPQKNAEVYYKKGKRQQLEINILHEAITKKSQEIATLKRQLEDLYSIRDIKTLKDFKSRAGIKEKTTTIESLPFHEFEFHGFRILVGRNAKSNDTLTLKYTFKEDLWLHAKDVAGSHVVIKHQAGKNIPKDVIERAAQLAAYYSKRKTESLCPVIVTPKKFVRKRKGDPAGMVVVEREETILVEPKAWQSAVSRP